MEFICIDIGLKTGVAWGSLESGIDDYCEQNMRSKAKHHGAKFANFHKYFDDFFFWHDEIDFVVYEAIYRHRGARDAHAFGGYKAILQMLCYKYEKQLIEVSPAEIKKHITGKGNAKKEEVIKAVEALGYSGVTDNEADAIAMAHLFLHENRK